MAPTILTYTAESWTAACAEQRITDPLMVATAALGYCVSVIARNRKPDNQMAENAISFQAGLVLASIEPNAAGWLLEEMSSSNPPMDRELQAASHFVAAVLDHVRAGR